MILPNIWKKNMFQTTNQISTLMKPIYICWDEPLASVRQNFAMIANLPVMFSGKVQELRNIAHKAC
jgi:hypothetical protein